MTEQPPVGGTTRDEDQVGAGVARGPRHGYRLVEGFYIRSRRTTRLVFGLVLLSLGALWTLDNLGLVDAQRIVRWWPALLIAFGVAKLAGWSARRSAFLAWLYIVAGAWLLLHAVGWVHVGIAGLWPLLLIGLGVRLVLRAGDASGPKTGRGKSTWSMGADGRVKMDVVMAGANRRSSAGAFRGGEINAVLGNIELDLRDATLTDGRTELEVNAILGGVQLLVPRRWRIESQIVSVLGSVEDHTRSEPGAGSEVLVLLGNTALGGIEIRN
jgi:hypothetical protein